MPLLVSLGHKCLQQTLDHTADVTVTALSSKDGHVPSNAHRVTLTISSHAIMAAQLICTAGDSFALCSMLVGTARVHLPAKNTSHCFCRYPMMTRVKMLLQAWIEQSQKACDVRSAS